MSRLLPHGFAAMGFFVSFGFIHSNFFTMEENKNQGPGQSPGAGTQETPNPPTPPPAEDAGKESAEARIARIKARTPNSVTDYDNPIFKVVLMGPEGNKELPVGVTSDGVLVDLKEGLELRLLACGLGDRGRSPFRYGHLNVWIDHAGMELVEGQLGEKLKEFAAENVVQDFEVDQISNLTETMAKSVDELLATVIA